MKKAFVVLSTVFILTVTNLYAQSDSENSSSYTTALGFKFYPTAITLKYFITDRHAVEGLGYFFNYGARITGLYEIHSDITGVEGLQWYVGPGAHLGFYNNKYGGGTVVGVDGVLGLDYKVNVAPINLSVDFQPSVEFGEHFNNGFTGWGGIAIRYTF